MSIFKYFTMEAHARAFMTRGAMLVRPLSYFRAYEDGQIRGDSSDGTLAYAPTEGLVLTKEDGTVLTVEGGRFMSSAKCDDIFVFCASNQMTGELAERFESPFCVEITDPERLVRHVRARGRAASYLDYQKLTSGSVDYRSSKQKPGADWALPDKLAFIKPESFAWQDEFRIALGKRGAFDVENVDCAIDTGTANAPATLPNQSHLILRLGRLTDFARLHRF